jgi:sugar lactone lactonase YvrE
MAQEELEIPDGVSVSNDGRWMAVSDHDHHRIVVYNFEKAALSCELRDPDLHHPHGLCFDPSARNLYVGDAGGRRVHVFATSGEWDTCSDTSLHKLLAVDESAFRKTHEATAEENRPLEGGTKGIDIDPTGSIMATTCRHQLLRFFEVLPAASQPVRPMPVPERQKAH